MDAVDPYDAVRIGRLLAADAAAGAVPALRHAIDTGELAAATAGELGLPPAQRERCRAAGLVHDVGKAVVPAAVLAKPAALDPGEERRVRDHPVRGAELVAQVPALARVAPAVRHHHERWDGTGYPAGLARDAIPLEARVVAAADAYVTIVAGRPYRPARPPVRALRELDRVAGTQLDPLVVRALRRVVRRRLATES